MKKCELCKKVARMYCDSDQASLCWDCDYRVHTANFIVSKHTRTLLCRTCQSLTPWTGSGSKLGPTISLCNACLNRRNHRSDDEDEDEGDDRTPEEDDDDDDGENQVVPLSLPTSLASTSEGSSEATSSRFSYHEEKNGFRSWKWR
ncbi:hypothetical protein ACS0TY_031190 [Phlomoides rotata]